MTLDSLNRLADLEDFLSDDCGFASPGVDVNVGDNGAAFATAHFLPSDLAVDIVARFGGIVENCCGHCAVVPL